MPKMSAYIALSGPIFYDYKNMLKWPYPNPVLEAPLDLMILYDEIIFIDEIVCPKSMLCVIICFSSSSRYSGSSAYGFGTQWTMPFSSLTSSQSSQG
jgi:hypothetical protein